MPDMGFEEASVIEGIEEPYAYDRWANRRMLDAASPLSADELARDLGTGFPPARDTLAHILAAEAESTP